ncbi:MAG: carbohydrate kinase [Candidatus Azobacteroides sp.]|nr:carbohydrate kinase [Candidatus Azobacteroides sp.]
MRKIIGVGETVLDIIFENNRPTKAIPGGSVFNTMVSLSRMNVPVEFISEVGQDRIGSIILDFMKENGMDTKHVSTFPDGKSALSCAFLNQNSDAEYLFYRDYPAQRLESVVPFIEPDDIFIFGSYYALNPALRPQIFELLTFAQERKAIIYYDPNFRSLHAHEALRLQSTLIENLEFADIVRGSNEDFMNLYELKDADAVYNEKMRFYAGNLIYTKGKDGVSLRTRAVSKDYDVPEIKAVSTVGAGDSFNAGVLFGLLACDVKKDDLAHLSVSTWDDIMRYAIDFSVEVCKNLQNYVSVDFAQKYLQAATHRS